jgi:Ca2+-transporting ATPase
VTGRPARRPAREIGRDWHALRAEEALAALSSSATRGLSQEDVGRRLRRFGPNALPQPKRRTLASIFLRQFASPLIYLLLLAAGIAFLIGRPSDAAVISVVVVVNALIGTLQEGRAERSLAALRRMTGQQARVLREGREATVPARDLVPGDILLLAAGDAVAADARLFEGAAIQIAEAALTGESLPVDKDMLPLAPDTPLTDRRNMVYAGTHVAAGRARAVVAATGLSTEIGRIAELAETAREPQTPLERRVDQFGRRLMLAATFLFAGIVALGWLREMPIGDVAMLAISQVVGLIPEGLPVAMSIALAVGVQRMARRRAIVRRPAAVETLGCTTVICSDKTGTLTRNEMTATAIWLGSGREIAVTGAGYAPEGEFLEDGRAIQPEADAELSALLEAAVLCNDAQLVAPDANEPRWRAIGDPTEAALLALGVKAGVVGSALREQIPRRAELPFDPAAKMMATQHAGPAGPRVLLKGAPEVVVALCATLGRGDRTAPLDEAASRAVGSAVRRMAERALRVLAVASVEGAEIDGHAGFAAFRGRGVLLGLVGQIDPPRLEAANAVTRCREAGIRPVMVTGDHAVTALAVARTLGIAREGDLVLEGAELARLSEADLAGCLDRVSVFARVHPAQKLRIVGAYQRQSEVVAMTGDGVNDAPALVRADVGVAMGVTGTDVAKEAAKIVVTDDDFSTIVAAVEEGRVVYRNIKKVILLLATTSVAEVIVLMGAMLLGLPAPFMAVQILWNNLVTEGVIAVNLIMEPAEGDEMRHPPIPFDEPLITRALLGRMGVMTPAIVISSLGWFTARMAAGVPLIQAQSETFTLLVVCEWFNVLNCRSETRSALDLGLLRNPWLMGGLAVGNLLQVAVIFWLPLGALFHTVAIGGREIVAIGAVGSLVLWVEEARKLIARGRLRRRAAGAGFR